VNDQSNPATGSDLASDGRLEDPLEIVADIERKWALYVRSDPFTLSTQLYDQRAIFFGSKDEMFVGQNGVARYFEGVPRGYVMDARFSERAVSQIAENVIISGGYVTFCLSGPEGPVDALFRITLTLVKTAGGWKIAQHHASPRVKG
jgi:ketosteroid isomerase-like protein